MFSGSELQGEHLASTPLNSTQPKPAGHGESTPADPTAGESHSQHTKESSRPHAVLATATSKLSLRERFEAFIEGLALLPSDLERLEECEEACRKIAPQIKEGASATLCAAILLALNQQKGYHLARLDPETGKPATRSVSKYNQQLLASLDVGSSDTQISRHGWSGKLYLKLVERKLPTPNTAYLLSLLVPLHKRNLDKIADDVARLTDNGSKPFPPKSVIETHVEKLRPSKRKKKKDKLETKQLRQTCELTLRALTGDTNAQPLAKKAMEDLIIVLRMKETGEKAQTNKKNVPKKAATQPALSPSKGAATNAKSEQAESTGEQTPNRQVLAENNSLQPPAKPALPERDAGAFLRDDSEVHAERVGHVLVERQGCELRATLTARNEGLFAAYGAYVQTRRDEKLPWKFIPGLYCQNFHGGKGVHRCILPNAQAADDELRAFAAWAKQAQGL